MKTKRELEEEMALALAAKDGPAVRALQAKLNSILLKEVQGQRDERAEK